MLVALGLSMGSSVVHLDHELVIVLATLNGEKLPADLIAHGNNCYLGSGHSPLHRGSSSSCSLAADATCGAVPLLAAMTTGFTARGIFVALKSRSVLDVFNALLCLGIVIASALLAAPNGNALYKGKATPDHMIGMAFFHFIVFVLSFSGIVVNSVAEYMKPLQQKFKAA